MNINSKASKLADKVESLVSECALFISQLRSPLANDTSGMLHRYEQAENIRRSIAIRNTILPRHVLGDAIWEIMLFLYIQSKDGRFVSASQICGAIGVPATTTLRTLGNMKRRGLIAAKRDKLDNRKKAIYLTAQTKAALTYWLVLHGD